MAERQLPGLGLTGFWLPGSDGWDTGMDGNLRMLSAVTQMGVLSKVTALPASPADGQIYIVPSGADANKIAIRDNGAWVYLIPKAGWRAWLADTSSFAHFDGSAWVDDTDNEGIPDAPSDGKTYGRKDGDWSEVTSGGGATSAAVSVYVPGTFGVSQKLLDYPMLFDASLSVGAAGSVAKAGTAPSAAKSFALLKNGTSVGTVDFAANATDGTFTVASGVAFIAGDLLSISAPATADAALADVAISLKLSL
ncbi:MULTISPECIES: DUF2793 domain-containing protein [Brucella/Ochrobactrum group]|uniref:DUF2793 domain-containing protein n=1 Tax=Ochrobactrum sp. BTU2 TaxID=2856166 RepID=UPI00211A3F4D|nr:DUF2793 domain-containing protein [Ochrobactrum sp. BTU2]MCQ9146060.1 DUF2793 domain-containing protein [Ochrobactrum sp. BTU2]